MAIIVPAPVTIYIYSEQTHHTAAATWLTRHVGEVGLGCGEKTHRSLLGETRSGFLMDKIGIKTINILFCTQLHVRILSSEVVREYNLSAVMSVWIIGSTPAGAYSNMTLNVVRGVNPNYCLFNAF